VSEERLYCDMTVESRIMEKRGGRYEATVRYTFLQKRINAQQSRNLNCIVSSRYLATNREQRENSTDSVVVVIYSVLISENVIDICS
jgi:hypothetical protein